MDFNNTIPIYIQIEEDIKINIIKGIYQPGERLPSVRDLALDLKVNPNTIQKALGDLEDKKLIYTERTNGKFVTENKNIIEREKKNMAKNFVNNYLSSMKKINITKNEAIKFLDEEEKNESN